MKVLRTILLTGLVFLAAGCFKDTSIRTNYILKPLVQNLSTDPYEPLEGVKAYSFDADTSLYTVASYEDALNGVITLKGRPSEQITSPASTSEPYAQEGATGWIRLSLSSPTQMILAVDPTHRLYAYTQQEIEVNLPNLYVALPFKTWKEGNSYKDGNWSYYNEFYTPPVYRDCYVDAQVQLTEGGETTSISRMEVYAYAADTTAWYIASYDDAVSGKITSKADTTDTRTIPSFQGYADGTTGLYKLTVSAEQLMVVVADRSDRMYAYTQQTVDLTQTDALTLPALIFRPWRGVWHDATDTNGWLVVNPTYDPATATQNEQP